MCLDSFGEYGTISLIRVQGPPNVPRALLYLSSAQPASTPPAPRGAWCMFNPSQHQGTMWLPVTLQRCDFSNPGLKITIQWGQFSHLVSKGCTVSCLSVTQNKLFP